MARDFEDHCWKDVVDADTLQIYKAYHRKIYVGKNPAVLAIDLYNKAYLGGDRPVKEVDREFSGFGRVPTDQDGTFHFATIKPGAVPGPNGKEQAPHLAISIFMRGLQRQLTTRMYFPNDERNLKDPILNLVDTARRATLVAKAMSVTGGVGMLEWNVVLQGAHETVFFDLGL